MKVVILAGGYGTRIRDVADNIPKPMIPVGGAPILWHIMKYYASYGYKEFIICLGYKGDTIKDFFLNYKAYTNDFTIQLGDANSITYHNNHTEADWKVTLAETGLNSMTGARIKKIKKYIGEDQEFMLTYGDGVGDIDIDKLYKFHKNSGKLITVTGVRPPGRFGELVTDSEGIVSEFNEKPQTSGGRISGGFFVCNKGIFDYLEDREDLVFEKEPIERLVKDNQMASYAHDGFWQPMDTYRDYSYLNDLYNKKEAKWVRWK